MTASYGPCKFFLAEEHKSPFVSFMSNSVSCFPLFLFIVEFLFGLTVSWPFDWAFWCSSILKHACSPCIFISFSLFFCSLFSCGSLPPSQQTGCFLFQLFFILLFFFLLANLFSLHVLGVGFPLIFVRSSVPYFLNDLYSLSSDCPWFSGVCAFFSSFFFFDFSDFNCCEPVILVF